MIREKADAIAKGPHATGDTIGRNIGPDGRPKYTPMSGGIRNGTREHSRHVLGVA